MSKTAIIIPCFNESKRLDIENFSSFMKRNNQVDIYFYDDGSSDSTLNILIQLEKKFKNCFVLKNKINLGKAGTVRLGVQAALKKEKYNYIGYFDADLSTPIEEVSKFINVFQNNTSLILVMGCRIKRSGANIQRDNYRHYFSRVFVTLINFYFDLNFYDTQAGAKLFKNKNIENIFKEKFLTKWLFDIEILLRMKNLFASSNINNHVYELPLNTWIEKIGTKIKLVDIISIPILLRKVKNFYNK